MTRSISLLIHDDGKGRLGMFLGGDVGAAEAAKFCQAAANSFREIAMEAEVQRRLINAMEDAEDGDDEEV